jgi:hypothetical protein
MPFFFTFTTGYIITMEIYHHHHHGSNAHLMGEGMGKEMTWSRTHTRNSKINSFPGVVSPGRTFFHVYCFFFFHCCTLEETQLYIQMEVCPLYTMYSIILCVIYISLLYTHKYGFNDAMLYIRLGIGRKVDDISL